MGIPNSLSMKKNYLLPLVTLLALAAVLVQCVDPYRRSFTYDDDILLVEGFITDTGPIEVTIQNNRSVQSTSFLQNIGGAKVEVRSGSGEVIRLTESGAGRYVSSPSVRGRAGERYTLYFELLDGRKYESTAELLTPLRSRVSYTTEFVSSTQVVFENFNQQTMSATEVKADFDDPADETNYYFWQTRLFEFQPICLTCTNVEINTRTGDCNPPPAAPPVPSITYDYQCDRDCWDILGDTRVTVFSDALINGNNVKGFLVRQVPFYNDSGGLLEISQYNLSVGAFRYFELLKRQVETSGTFVDTPPAPPIGNIRNVDNPQELVTGYFGAGGKNTQRIWINRRGFPSPLIVSLLGREVLPAPRFEFVKAPCRASSTRTPIKPTGWR